MLMRKGSLITLVMALCVAVLLVGCGSAAQTNSSATQEEKKPVEVHLQAAASLHAAGDEIIAAYEQSHPNVKVIANYDASGTLAEQINNGAPADIFISANQAKMDDVEKAGHVKDKTRVNYLANDLVLIVPAGSDSHITSLQDCATDAVKALAVGEPKAVPAGKYAQQAIEAAGLTEALQSKLILGKDVTQTLTYVQTKDAQAGIVYKTDALKSDEMKAAVTIVATLQGHDPVIYPIAMIKQENQSAEAQDFYEFLKGSEAQQILQKYGFEPAAQ